MRPLNHVRPIMALLVLFIADGAAISEASTNEPGVISGKVLIDGEAPPPRIMPNTRDREFHPVRANAPGRLRDVVVRIEGILGRVRTASLKLAQSSGARPKIKALRHKESFNILAVIYDVHEFTGGWIFAADNPYCALVCDDGTFVIEGIPPGEHEIKAWHPYLGI